MAPIAPEVLWAQRSSTSDPLHNIIYLTINLKDPEQSSVELDIKDTSLDLNAKSTTSDEEYSLHIDFYKEIDSSSVREVITGSHIFLVLVKKELQEEYWPRLTKEKLKYNNIRTDFDKWVDEDEQDGADDEKLDPMAGLGGMDDLSAFSENNMDFSELAKQFGGKGGLSAGDAGSDKFGDLANAEFSSSGDEDEDNDKESSHGHEE